MDLSGVGVREEGDDELLALFTESLEVDGRCWKWLRADKGLLLMFFSR